MKLLCSRVRYLPRLHVMVFKARWRRVHCKQTFQLQNLDAETPSNPPPRLALEKGGEAKGVVANQSRCHPSRLHKPDGSLGAMEAERSFDGSRVRSRPPIDLEWPMESPTC